MLRVGIFSDEISQDFEYALKVIKELGVRYVELRSMWGKNLMNLSSSELNKVKELIEKYGLKVCLIASPVFKCYLSQKKVTSSKKDTFLMEEKTYSEHLNLLEYSFEIARIFDTNLVRIFSFWKEGDLTDDVLREIIQRFEEPVKKAEKEGITLALENEHACYIGNGKDSKRVLERLPSKNLGLIWDPGNAYFTGENPYPDGYELIKDRIVHVHLKDAGKDKEGKPVWLPIGKGEIDFKGQLKALDNANFQGVVSLETHYVPKNGSKEEGTRESFQGLQSILQSLGIKII